MSQTTGAPAPNRFAGVGLAFAGLVAFLALWEAVPKLGLVNAAFLPPPSVLPAAFWREVVTGQWLSAILGSLGHYTLGLATGVGAGATFGIVTGMYPRAEAFVAGIVRVLRPVPGLAWVPFAILWFGVSPAAAVFIIAVGVFWIVYFAALGAVRGVDADLLELARAFGFRSGWARLVKVILPGATPGLLTGIRTALGQAWMAVVAAEIFGVAGVGQRMMQASSLLATDVVVIYMLTMALLYGLVDTVFMGISAWLLRWRR